MFSVQLSLKLFILSCKSLKVYVPRSKRDCCNSGLVTFQISCLLNVYQLKYHQISFHEGILQITHKYIHTCVYVLLKYYLTRMIHFNDNK